MSAKDLNLSFDRELARARSAGADATRGSSERKGGAGRRAGAGAANRRKNQAWQARKPQPWLLPALIVLVNMAFLLVAGLWLTGTDFHRPPTREAAVASAMPMATNELTALQTRLDAIQEQLTVLQSTLEEQQRLLLFSRLEALQSADPDQVNAEDSAATPASSAPAWQINLGHFDTRAEAVAVQSDLGKLGYAASLEAADDGGVRLLLGGFRERKLAELTAKDIMQSTRLNGLWVSGGE